MDKQINAFMKEIGVVRFPECDHPDHLVEECPSCNHLWAEHEPLYTPYGMMALCPEYRPTQRVNVGTG